MEQNLIYRQVHGRHPWAVVFMPLGGTREEEGRKGAGGHSFVSPRASLQFADYLPESSLYTCLCPNFFSCHQGTPLHCPAQAAKVAYTHGSYRTTTRRKTAILRAQQEVTDPGAQSSCERGLKAYHH